MVDIHHHLLPALDDGSKDIQTSIAMAKMATADGITHIVATPHANSSYAFDPVINAQRIEELQSQLTAQGIAITLGSGCDFHLSYDNLQHAYRDPARFCINGHRYLLVELPDFVIPRQLDESFYELRIAGIEPILTHPERNPALQKDSSRLEDWLRQGMLVQVTTSSVLGQMGSTPERMAHRLLANRWVHFLASDAHNLKSRPPKMKAAYDAVAQRYGRAYAERICVENPLAVFEGRDLPAQDEPLKLHETKSSFFQRLFRK